jgi:hypothetical protein
VIVAAGAGVASAAIAATTVTALKIWLDRMASPPGSCGPGRPPDDLGAAGSGQFQPPDL